ncbi:hypothetical protein QJS10_CPA06g00794 [Acorus calamus]|uniref:DUF1677 family protein n=1 Tax=Acorus calamus TaxID=4465 RepID=A0AAV9EP56_ACOCL|nr:hypothetical protein QJS10_CPA06g00798 [Acorus calamus]KAK1314775.1 hypothetical protein QJS10_CPA06g00794 [Acorus calamus]
MAPNTVTLVSTTTHNTKLFMPPPRLSMESLQRAVSDLSFELSKAAIAVDHHHLPPPMIFEAKCECCGMSEECTPDYIRRVRDRSCGRWICGLCTEAVEEEMAKNGQKKEEAIQTHMGACIRFNKFGRAYPVLGQAEAMREMLKRNNYRSKSNSPRERGGGGGGGGAKKAAIISRSTSCIPAIMEDVNSL